LPVFVYFASFRTLHLPVFVCFKIIFGKILFWIEENRQAIKRLKYTDQTSKMVENPFLILFLNLKKIKWIFASFRIFCQFSYVEKNFWKNIILNRRKQLFSFHKWSSWLQMAKKLYETSSAVLHITNIGNFAYIRKLAKYKILCPVFVCAGFGKFV